MGKGYLAITCGIAGLLSTGFGAGVWMGGQHPTLGVGLFVGGVAGLVGLVIGLMDS